jgi:hypothetical protein
LILHRILAEWAFSGLRGLVIDAGGAAPPSKSTSSNWRIVVSLDQILGALETQN